MRFLSLAAVIIALAVPASAQEHVDGYFRSNGTYVQPYYRSAPDSTTTNNYDVKPNVNPYTGQEGTREPTYSPQSSYSPYGVNNLNRR
jgi:hypothetical protein